MENHLLLFCSRVCLFLSLTFHVWISISPFTKSTVASLPNGQGLITKLIHRDSILSPTYRKDSTIEDRSSFLIKSSEERLAYLDTIVNGGGSTSVQPNAEATLIPNSPETTFLINVTIGEPAVQQFLIFDTGSSLLWVHCAPCDTCSKRPKLRYRPSKSSTYAPVTCNPTDCKQVYNGHCDSEGYCQYSIRYGDGTNSSGTIAYEKFTFPTNDRGTAVFNSLIFGCGTKHNDAHLQSSGLLGLNAGKSSILTSLGATKFSYCIGSIRDHFDLRSFVAIGNDDAYLEGYKTPFQLSRGGMFFVTLEGVGVNYEKNITADPSIFKFGLLLDSGTTMTFLVSSLYRPLKAEVMAQLEKKGLHAIPPPVRIAYRNPLCYNGDMDSDLPDIPLVFYLPGISIDVNRETLFYQVKKDVFCMVIVETNRNLNVLGVLNQQFSNIGFDLESKLISYQNADCDILLARSSMI